MRRVYVVFFLRKVVKPFVIKMGSVAALGVAVATLVSVQNVLGNMPSRPRARFATYRSTTGCNVIHPSASRTRHLPLG
ncbi:MAG: hypothetical protein UX81_C0026G0013 [Parcubacteria group bacterium GW2011_GWA2_47_12]|nr:MAG: hypothetical protein UX81_C0026G0013 [Parcubacteria group bacterium GW2011_GWA2_47_12]